MAIESRTVDIWTVNLNEAREIHLAPDEAVRAARLIREADRVHWSRSRSALRQVLASYLGCGPLELRFNRGEHGKPSIECGPAFNLSHSGEWALIAVARQAEIGVDIERQREDVDIAKLLARIGEKDLPETRPALFQRWARREASTKATGSALMRPVDPRVYVADLEAPAGYAAAIAMCDFQPEPVYCGGR
jgi:4'-phosphopantetheinyl transferase